MKDMDENRLLGQHLSGDPPREAFREQVFGDSLAALVRARSQRSAQRRAELAAAAVLIAGIAFLGGRSSVPRGRPGSMAGTPGAVVEHDGVTVPMELVEWVEAARLFGQLGMEERMALAVERAGRLLPQPAATASAPGQVFTGVGNPIAQSEIMHAGVSGTAAALESGNNVNTALAKSFGGYDHASKMD